MTDERKALVTAIINYAAREGYTMQDPRFRMYLSAVELSAEEFAIVEENVKS